jgi:hypothetical protein
MLWIIELFHRTTSSTAFVNRFGSGGDFRVQIVDILFEPHDGYLYGVNLRAERKGGVAHFGTPSAQLTSCRLFYGIQTIND